MSRKPGNLPPCSFVIFGATGNLSYNKLLPSLYHLEAANRLPDGLHFVAFARRPWGLDEWTGFVREALEKKLGDEVQPEILQRFSDRFGYVQGELHEPEAYQRLLEEVSKPREGTCSSIASYLAIRPEDFQPVIKNLSAVGLNGGEHRIVVEKPFGRDLESAEMLNQVLHRHFREDQVYRIDHYLGKETVQNVMVFRFANTIIEPLWNRHFIDHVQITVAESVGIEKRAGYYDGAGALRDMLQNHLMQLLTVVGMEPPPCMDADSLRDEKVKVLRSIRPIPKSAVHTHAIRAQYGPGVVNGEQVAGYQDEEGVEPDSMTETFVAAKFYIDNWRWRGVPFYLRTGKRMPQQLSMIAIRFRHPPQQLFRETPLEFIEPNWAILSIQPEESMRLEVHAKQPGLGMDTRTLSLNASFRNTGEEQLDAYETLLLDIIEGDRTHFIRFDEVEWGWRVVDPIQQYWERQRDFIHSYPAGTWGLQEANRLFDGEDQEWRNHV